MKRLKTLLKDIPNVSNMESSNGNDIPNQFIIRTANGYFFQSYSTIIVAQISGQTILDREKWDYSTTTGKYRNIFLCEKRPETERKIKEGIYKLADLN